MRVTTVHVGCPSLATLHGGAFAATIVHVARNSITTVHGGKFSLAPLQPGASDIVYPTGSYEIDSIENIAQQTDPSVSIKPDTVTLRSHVYSDHAIDFRPDDSIGCLLGFAPRVLRAKETHHSVFPIAILTINAIRVECNITGVSYINGEKAHTIHDFFPVVPAGFKIIEIPAYPIYLPINVSSVHHLQLRLLKHAVQTALQSCFCR